ncbi:MAG: sodium:solute symporter family protein [Bacteroidota bacterium]
MTGIQKSIRAGLLLFGALSLLGIFVYVFTDLEVYWPGFFSMIGFYALIFGLGAYASSFKISGSVDEVMLAGRRLPLVLAVFTMSATWVGGGYINGSAEYAATDGYGLLWVQAPWGYALSLVVGGLFFARKMHRYQFSTMLDPLARRFGKTSGALFFLPALSGEVFWSAAILTALGTTFGTVLGLDFNASILLSAVIAISYTVIGGLWAVAMTDLLQLGLLFLGLVIVVPVAMSQVGSWPEIWASYQEKKGPLASFLPSREALGSYYWNWWDFALLLIFGGIPWQVYFQRVLAAKSAKVAMYLSFFAAIVCILAAIPAVLIGIIGDVANWEAFGVTAPENQALVLPYVVRYLTNPVVATIGLGAIAAAVMSSVDSSILSAASMASWNVYRPLFRPDLSPEQLTKVLKKCIWIIGLAAALLALQVQSVYALWFLCSDFVYCLLFPQLLMALFDPKANRIGSLCGFAIALFLRFGGGDATLGLPIWLPYPMVEDGVVLFPFRTMAMLSSVVAIWLVSRLTQHWSPARSLDPPAPSVS